MQIVRDTYERVQGRYVLNVDENYRKNLVDYLNEHIVNAEDKLDELTEEHIKTIVYEDWDGDAELDKEVEIRLWSGKPDKYNIAEVLFDIINNDIWDSYYETLDSETDNYETCIKY